MTTFRSSQGSAMEQFSQEPGKTTELVTAANESDNKCKLSANGELTVISYIFHNKRVKCVNIADTRVLKLNYDYDCCKY